MFGFGRKKTKEENPEEVTEEVIAEDNATVEVETAPDSEKGKHPINHRGSGGKEYDNFQPVMSLISFPPVEDNLVSTELSPVKGVNSVLTEKVVEERSEEQPEEQPKKQGFFAGLKAKLGKTRDSLTDGVASLVLGEKEIDDDMLEELETQLLVSDMGVDATNTIISNLSERISYNELSDEDALFAALHEEMVAILEPCSEPLDISCEDKPFVILMIGINGAGKTTTIGKLAKQQQGEGKSVILAAGDTFRAAAVEQLQVWGVRNDIPVVAQHTGADSASVVYDALSSAKSRDCDLLLADTAGRLHNKSNLMDELHKVKRVLAKLDPQAPHEVMLVLDAGTGQNGLAQAEQFHKDIGITGVTITKLDGTAKGGIIFAIAKKLGLPIRFIGVGEGIDDLRKFDANEFVTALLERDK